MPQHDAAALVCAARRVLPAACRVSLSLARSAKRAARDSANCLVRFVVDDLYVDGAFTAQPLALTLESRRLLACCHRSRDQPL
eukprot:CAMPEP_0119334068 /NCGR_PEP_ID=MMETSP1333-20130426/86594_1 /TAXON_ID=418940 /ORGANISM="Scyphosphaera apsteinii, Strain RCC1455" /LENGTH=82 /DNA_ID=CAMNT_0007344289 /DNA_START=58 /DNA_END=303 /DNA_ORIENTATION=-